MHPDLQGEGAQVETPRKRLHPQQPPKTICRRPPSRILCREGSVAPFSPCTALPALIPVQGPAWGRLCLLLATFLCLGRDKEGATGSACRVPRAVLLLPGKFRCHLPSGTLRSARQRCVPKINHLGVALILWTYRLSSKASPQMPCSKILGAERGGLFFLPQKTRFHGNIALGCVIAASAQLC